MKCLIVLLVLGFSLFSPVSIQFLPSGKGEILVTLDVCHAGGDGVSVNVELPVIHESPGGLISAELADLLETDSRSFTSSLFSIRIEQPPKI